MDPLDLDHSSATTRPVSPPVSVLSRPPLLSDRSTSSSSSTTLISSTPTCTPPKLPRPISGTSSSIAHPPPSAYQQSQRNSTLVSQKLFDGQDTRLELLTTLRISKEDAEWEIIDAKDIPLVPDRRPSATKKLSRKTSRNMSTMDPQRPSSSSPSKKGSQGGGFFRRLTQSGHHGPSAASAPTTQQTAPQLPRISSFLDNNDPRVGARDSLLSGTQFSSSNPHTPSPNSMASRKTSMLWLPPGAAPADFSNPRPAPVRQTSNGYGRPEPPHMNGLANGGANGYPHVNVHANGYRPMNGAPNGHAYPARPPPGPSGYHAPPAKAPVTAALAAPPMSPPMSPPTSPDRTYFNGPNAFAVQSQPQQVYSRPPLLDGPVRQSPPHAPEQPRPNGTSYQAPGPSAQRPGSAPIANRFAPPPNSYSGHPAGPQYAQRPPPARQTSHGSQTGRPPSPTSSHGHHSMSGHSSAHGHQMMVRPMAPMTRPPIGYNARPPMSGAPPPGHYPPGAMPPGAMPPGAAPPHAMGLPEARVNGSMIVPPARGASKAAVGRPPMYAHPPPTGMMMNGPTRPQQMMSPPMPPQQMMSPPQAHQQLRSPPQVHQQMMSPPMAAQQLRSPPMAPQQLPQQVRSPPMAPQQLPQQQAPQRAIAPPMVPQVPGVPQLPVAPKANGSVPRPTYSNEFAESPQVMTPVSAHPQPPQRPPREAPPPLAKSPEYAPAPLRKSPEYKPAPVLKAAEYTPAPVHKAAEYTPAPVHKAPEYTPAPVRKSPPQQSAPMDKSRSYTPPTRKSPPALEIVPGVPPAPVHARALSKSPPVAAAPLPRTGPAAAAATTNALSGPLSPASPNSQFSSNSGGTFQVISSSSSKPSSKPSLPATPTTASFDGGSPSTPSRPRIVIPTAKTAPPPEARPYQSAILPAAGAPPPSSLTPAGPVASGQGAQGPAPLTRPERSPHRNPPSLPKEEPAPHTSAASATASAVVATSAAAVLAAETRARSESMRTRKLSEAGAIKAEVLKAEALKQKAEAARREPTVAEEAKPAKSNPEGVDFSAPRSQASSFSSDKRDLYAGLATKGQRPPLPLVPADQLPPRSRSHSSESARRAVTSPVGNTASPLGPNRGTKPAPIQTNGVAAAEPGSARSVSAHPRIGDIAGEAAAEGDVAHSPTTSTHSRNSSTSIMDRPRPKPKKEMTMTLLCKNPRIVISLLPYFNINSFLNLLGSDDEIRKFITGEMVGRWVTREWGVTVDRERGRSWPGLTVWEGFLESLLHDPAVYSTYPAQYHNLLRHLSLSHTLIVLFLRTLPASAFPYSPPVPFDDDISQPAFHKSASVSSFQNMKLPQRPGSRTGSVSESGHARMPRRERVTEVIMPEPLSAGPKTAPGGARSIAEMLPMPNHGRLKKRRGSVGSANASTTSLGFGRVKRSNSVSSIVTEHLNAPQAHVAAVMPQGKAAFPPVSYPTAKRYEFKRYGDPSLLSPAGTVAASSRPGSIASAQTSIRHGFGINRSRPPSTRANSEMLPVPPPLFGSRGKERSSVASSDGRSSNGRHSEQGGSHSPPGTRRWDSPTNGGSRYEPAFDRPPPYMVGRAPILRVFVPVNDRVSRWPSSEGAAAAWRELEKCGANKRMRLGDLVVNTALHKPSNTEHVLVYVPFVQHKLVPLEYTHCSTGHLPHYLDAFAVSPIYYDPFLPVPQIIYLDFSQFAVQAMQSLRLAYDRRDVTVASGARVSAKRYLHVAGVEISAADRVAPEWHGMVSLEAEGTAEGRAEMESRFGKGDPQHCQMGPWEVVRERSMMGSIWLRLVREQTSNADGAARR